MRRDSSELPVEIIPLGIGEQQVFYAFLRDITERNRVDTLARQRLLEAQVLYEASSLIAQGGTEDEIFRHLLEKICQLSGWTVAHVYRPDALEHPNCLIPTGIWHAEDDSLESLRVDTLSYSMREGEGLPERIWASGDSAWIEDIEAAPGFPRRDLYVAHGLRAAFGFPVLLTVSDSRTRGYDSALIEGSVTRALEGKVHLEFWPSGLSAAIFLPTRHFAGPQFLLLEKFARPQDA